MTDIGGLNDRSFNFLANKGLEDSADELGAETRVLVSESNADYIPNLTTLTQQQFDIIVPVGFRMGDATNTIATEVPDANFAIVDYPATILEDKPKNVEGLLFAEQEAGYLAGYVAGLWAKDNNATTVSTVAGEKIPPVDHYIAGFQAGAKAANPKIKTLNAYSQTLRRTRRSARSWRSTRSRRARRSSSRWPAAAGWARSTRPRRRACRGSAWTPTRATSASTS